MSTFDAEIFAQAVLADVQDVLDKAEEESADVRVELSDLRNDIEATLSALEVERDNRRARALRQDLETFLPARKAAILSAAESRFSGEVRAALENALTVATRAAIVVAKAFVTAGGI
ncbi:MAG TPA: hypothetical protein VFF73_38450 [Planctomycetota bacterium]|nr:hypothetical protein [Planctomycetota bacterium]